MSSLVKCRLCSDFPALKFKNLRHERQLTEGVWHVVDAQLNQCPVPAIGKEFNGCAVEFNLINFNKLKQVVVILVQECHP